MSNLISRDDFIMNLGSHEESVSESLLKLIDENIIERIWKKDHTVWNEDPTEISNRLGWLDSPEEAIQHLDDIDKFVNEVRKERFTHALLLGMGGSSLAPEVLRLTFGVRDGYLDLHVLDSTDPGAVLEYQRKLDPAKTLYIVSTKSGGTIETLSFMKYFYRVVLLKLGAEEVGNHFIAITDPGSGLESMAQELNFRKIFLNNPNIGGRYSALSLFGLVPAALIGINTSNLIERVLKMVSASKLSGENISNNSAAELGIILAEFANKGVDKLTFILSDEIKHFGTWVEQLIAESTGKDGKGILPVEGELLMEPETYSRDRLFIYIRVKNDNELNIKVKEFIEKDFPVVEIILRDIYDLGSEFFRWEMATVIAGWLMNIQPFDQPNVESAKIIARKKVSAYQEKGELPELKPTLEEENIKVCGLTTAQKLEDVLPDFLKLLKPGIDNYFGRSYVAIQAFANPEERTNEALEILRTKIQNKYKVAVTVGYGPRFLHSTGQLHKGDAGKGLFIQIFSDKTEDAQIPDEATSESSSISFGVLIKAQSLGDREALIENKRNVIRFEISKNVEEDLKKITKAL